MSYAAEWDAEHAIREMRCDEPLPPVREFFAPYIAEMDPEKPPLSVLDIGCGQGTNTLWLARHGFRVFGFDSSPSAVQRLLDAFTAKRVSPHIPHVTIADATKPWPYRSGTFDVAFEIRSLENLDEEEVKFAYRQIGRVLKRGGWFMCLTASERRPNRYTTCGKVRQVSDMVLAEMLKAAGIEIEQISRQYEGTLEDWKVIARKP
jgi:SAM-dependent methyltransferase